ncbi:NifB/NifX family molybdenum-iron cluster-binding protein [Spirochaetota bacterium]
MKRKNIAIPVYKERVSPLFDVSSKFSIIKFENKTITKRYNLDLEMGPDFNRLEKLINSEINTIICSAISKPYADYILSKDIVLIPGVIGQIEEVIEAYIDDKLVIDCFAMPGYRWRGKSKQTGNRRRQCLRYQEIIDLNKKEN